MSNNNSFVAALPLSKRRMDLIPWRVVLVVASLALLIHVATTTHGQEKKLFEGRVAPVSPSPAMTGEGLSSAAATVEIFILPVCPPPGEPPYPPGNVIDGNRLDLPADATIAWFEIYIRNWEQAAASAGNSEQIDAPEETPEPALAQGQGACCSVPPATCNETDAASCDPLTSYFVPDGHCLNGSCSSGFGRCCTSGFCNITTASLCSGGFTLGSNCTTPCPAPPPKPSEVFMVAKKPTTGTVCLYALLGKFDSSRPDRIHPGGLGGFSEEGGDLFFETFGEPREEGGVPGYIGEFGLTLGANCDPGSLFTLEIDQVRSSILDPFENPIPFFASSAFVQFGGGIIPDPTAAAAVSAAGSSCPSTVPTTSFWGLAVLTLALLGVGRRTFTRRSQG